MMAQSVEEDIYRLETGLRNLNVELETTKLVSNGMQNSISQKNSLPCNNDNVKQQSCVPNFNEANAVNDTISSANPSQSWIKSDKGATTTKIMQNSRHFQESLNSSPVTDLMCSKQARNEDCSSVDELAGYFDNLLYIPRKMSPMAEMMYM